MPRRKPLLIGSLAAATVAAAVSGLAATMVLTPAGLGASNAGVSACDGDGVTTAYGSTWDVTDAGYRVTSVMVKGVADGCDGLTLKVALTDGAGADIGSGVLALPAGAAVDHSVAVSPSAPAEDIASVHVVIG